LKKLMKAKLLIICISSFLFAGEKILFLSNDIVDANGNAIIDIHLNSDEPVRGFQLTIKYDSTLISYDTIVATNYLENFNLSVNEPEKGILNIIAINFSGETIKEGLGSLASISFNNININAFTFSKLTISNPVLSYNNAISHYPNVFPAYILGQEQSHISILRSQLNWFINLANEQEFSAMQFSFDYDTNKVIVDSLKGLDRLNGFNLSWNEPEIGKIKIVINSNDNSVIKPESSPLMQLFIRIKDKTHSENDFSFSKSFGVDPDAQIIEILPLYSYHVNSPPILSGIENKTIDEDQIIDIILNATDVEGDVITFSALSDSNEVTTSISGSTLTLTPKANWNGVATITAYASDGTHKDSTTFKLTVTPVNDIAAVADVTIDEDKSAEVALTTTFTGTTTFTAVSVSDSVTASISASTLTLTPNANWNGATNITAYASNSTFKDSTTFTLTVNPIPDLPGEFTWTNSTSEIDSITITSSNMSFEWNIGWDKSIDPDGEDVTYKIFNTNPPFNMVPVDLFELSFTQTTIDFPYETFILRWPSTLQMVNRLTYKYNVYAYSGNDSTEITGSRVLVVKREGDLNTESIELPNSFVLHPNYPNPFNPQTQIRFEMPYAGKIDLSIYNLLGVKIKTLYSGQKPSGVFTFKWDAKNDNNQLVSGGVYIYKLQSEKGVQMRKMILLK
jgi:hypothetical protein